MLSDDPLNDDEGDTQQTSVAIVCLSLKELRPQYNVDFDLLHFTGFTYDQLVKNFVRLVSRKNLCLPAQCRLFLLWQVCDSSDLLHTIMCKEIPSTVHVLDEAKSPPNPHPEICDLALTTWSILLKRPSSHQMHDVAEIVATGVILLVGGWIMHVTPELMSVF